MFLTSLGRPEANGIALPESVVDGGTCSTNSTDNLTSVTQCFVEVYCLWEFDQGKWNGSNESSVEWSDGPPTRLFTSFSPQGNLG